MLSRRVLFEQFSRVYSRTARWVYPLCVFPPSRIQLVMTARCNQACPHCVLGAAVNRRESNRLDLDEWARVIRSIPRTTLVSLSGAEPFMAPDIGPVLDMLFERRLFVSLVTNGTLLNSEMMARLVRGRLAYLGISIDGLADSHNRARGRDGAFQKISPAVQTLQRLKAEARSRAPALCVKTTLLGWNVDDITGLLEYVEHELKADEICFGFKVDQPVWAGFDTVQDTAEYGALTPNRCAYLHEEGAAVRESIRRILDYKKHSQLSICWAQLFPDEAGMLAFAEGAPWGVRRCDRPWSELHVFYDGRVTPCLRYEVGDIREMDYNVRHVMRQPRYREFLDFYRRQGDFFPHCNGCCNAPHSPLPPAS